MRINRKIIFIMGCVVCVPLLSFCFLTTIMWGHTGSPGEVTCANCHKTYPINTGGGYMQIATVPALVNNEYVPGQTYTVNVTVGRTGDSLFACDVEILDSLGHNKGTLIQTNSLAALNNNIPNNRMNVFGKGTNLNFLVFSFNWKAPAAGEANIYTAGIRYNNDGDYTGDYVYSDSLLHIKPASSNGIQKNKLNDGLLIYPNPVRENFNVSFTTNETDIIDELEIRDMFGRIIYSNKHIHVPFSVDAKNWASGNYYLHIKQKNNLYDKQLLKQ